MTVFIRCLQCYKNRNVSILNYKQTEPVYGCNASLPSITKFPREAGKKDMKVLTCMAKQKINRTHYPVCLSLALVSFMQILKCYIQQFNTKEQKRKKLSFIPFKFSFFHFRWRTQQLCPALYSVVTLFARFRG